MKLLIIGFVVLFTSSICLGFFGASKIPVAFRIYGSATIDNEIPLGFINGSNPKFTLATNPQPPTSLHVYRNGLRLKLSMDYFLNGSVITLSSPLQIGDSLIVDYRH